MREWQPIDTAPKDGTKILAWHPGWEVPTVIWWGLYYLITAGQRGVERYWWHAIDGTLLVGGEPETPTHWLRYPEPPNAT